MKELGATIRMARRKRGLTQDQLAKPLGMSRATISAIETGQVLEIGIRKVMAICASLGLELQAVDKRPYPTLQQLRQEQHDARTR